MNLLPVVFVLFSLGVYCLITRRNLIKVLIGIELLGKATVLALIWSGAVQGTIAYTQSLALVVIAVEVMVVALFLALMYAYYQQSNSLGTDELRRLKG